MSYTTPVTDRTAADIVAQNSKAYFNVADWERIYENSRLTSGLAEAILGTAIDFDLLAAPTTDVIPAVTDFNIFLANIERLRLAVVGESIPGTTTEIKDDYEEGVRKEAPDYLDANLWESTIDAIWVYFGGEDVEFCPTLTEDLIVATAEIKVFFDCLDVDTYDIEINGTGALYII